MFIGYMKEVNGVFEQYKLNHHCFADDIQARVELLQLCQHNYTTASPA